MSLSAGFAALRKHHNLVARRDFKCCQGCALNALSQEYNACEEDKRPDGYVFFHREDGKGLKRSGYTSLRFGVFAKKRKGSTAEIGKLVAKVLMEHGCPVDWNGDPQKALIVWVDADTRRRHALKMLGATVSP